MLTSEASAKGSEPENDEYPTAEIPEDSSDALLDRRGLALLLLLALALHDESLNPLLESSFHADSIAHEMRARASGFGIHQGSGMSRTIASTAIAFFSADVMPAQGLAAFSTSATT